MQLAPRSSPLETRFLTYLDAPSTPLAALRSSKGDQPFLRRTPCDQRRTRADICKQSRFQGTGLIALAFGLLLAVGSAPAVAQSVRSAQHANPDDPYRYDLRVGLFPVAFVAGISQSSFGSALRSELDVGHRLGLQLSGRLPWAEVTGQKDPPGFAFRAGLAIHLIDRVEWSELAGTVHPEDAAAPGGRGPGAPTDLEVPTSTKLATPRMAAPERSEGRAPVRHLHSLRLGYDLTRAIERARPPASDESTRYVLDTFHALYVGYGFGSHWSLSPATAGQREVGWRRFYLDLTLTMKPLVKRRAINDAARREPVSIFLPVGVRIGMEGAIAALLKRAPGVGFGYSIELGALPGYSGVEGYLLVGLGLALDLATGP